MNLNSKELKEIEKETTLILKDTGKYILKHWNDLHTLYYKDRRDVATEIDIEAERRIREKLHKILPEAGFFVEELKSNVLKGYNWVIDAIDGTKEYVSQSPLFFSQIALVKEDKPLLGQIFNPTSNQFFSASKDNGSKLNGKLIKPIIRSDLCNTMISVDYGGIKGDIEWKSKVVSNLMRKVYRVKIMAGFFAIYVLTGAIDSYIGINEFIKFVDLAPRIAIIRETGLFADYVKIGDHKIFIAANKILADKIINLLKN